MCRCMSVYECICVRVCVCVYVYSTGEKEQLQHTRAPRSGDKARHAAVHCNNSVHSTTQSSYWNS